LCRVALRVGAERRSALLLVPLFPSALAARLPLDGGAPSGFIVRAGAALVVGPADIERFLGGLSSGERRLSPASSNRFRDLLSGMYRRAVRLGLAPANPVKGIPKLREAAGRVVYLTAAEEQAIVEALSRELRPAITMSLYTGLRWSEQAGLWWRDVDVLADVITVGQSKNGDARRVPFNAVVRSVLVDIAGRRQRTDDPSEPIVRPGISDDGTSLRGRRPARQRGASRCREGCKQA
jgi:integrase